MAEQDAGLPRMQPSEFEYRLPSDRIALYPSEKRDQARLIRLVRATGRISHHRFTELPDLLTPRDLLVLNDTKVFPARLIGNRAGLTSDKPPPGGVLKAPIEVLLVRPLGPDTWETLVKPGRRIRVGERLQFGGGQLKAVVLERGERGVRVVRFQYQGDFDAIVDRLGHIPLPPYIRRPDERRDRTRYQTVYASKRGAVAAPTAGLHFTPQVLSGLSRKGVARCEVTLHVGLGTFRPVVSERIEDHRMETEPFEMTPEAARTISTAKSARQRIVAVGTTVTRVLESAFRGEEPQLRGETDLFIYPGFRFGRVGALLTNFHLPGSTLLMLVCAFAGRDFVFEAYREALAMDYRFYSYGDCMLIE